MKKYVLITLCLLVLASCAYDNYEAPKLQLKGTLVYQGEPINVSYNDVTLQLWEPGWQKKAKIDVSVDQDGSFSALLFPAKYKLFILESQGPFMSLKNADTQSDTIIFDLNSNKNLDVEVLPYYLVRNAQFLFSNGNLSANCKIDKIITDENAKNIERVSLYVSKTFFVDGRTSIPDVGIDMKGEDIVDMTNINMSTTLPTLTPTQNYVFARIGVKIANVEDMIFSPVTKVTLE